MAVRWATACGRGGTEGCTGGQVDRRSGLGERGCSLGVEAVQTGWDTDRSMSGVCSMGQ